MSSANAAAAQQFANRAASGQPLDVLFQQFGQVEAQELLNLIMSEIQQGINPRAMARDITRTLDQIDYGRAETIARTESLGSWNDAALANYQANSDIVGQWMWMCFPGAGTCVGCLEEDGTIYDLSEELNDHPNGRCVKAPLTNDYGSILSDYGIDTEGMDFGPSPWDDRQTGEEWLLAQDEATQIAAFGGKAPYYAWRSGDVPLKAFTKHVHDPVWGDHVAQQSLKGMGLNARDYAEGTIKERLAKQAAAEAYAATPIGQAEARLAVATQRARELEAMMAQAFASGRAQDAVLADYYHTVLVQRLTAQHDLERLREAQAAEAELRAAAEAAAMRAPAVSAEQFAQEQAHLLDLLRPPGAGIYSTQDRVAEELAARLANNPDFAQVAAKLNEFFAGNVVVKTPEDAAAALVRAWSGGTDNPISAALRLAVRDEFGLTTVLPADALKAAEWGADIRAGLQAYVRAVYENTQDFLRENGITDLALFRGNTVRELPKGIDAAMIDGQAHDLQIGLQAAASFTADEKWAAEFASFSQSGEAEYGIVMAGRVPAESVLSTARTGMGNLGEAEVLLLGGGERDLTMLGTRLAEGKITPEEIRTLLSAEGALPAGEAAAREAEAGTAARDLSQASDQELRALVGAPDGAEVHGSAVSRAAADELYPPVTPEDGRLVFKITISDPATGYGAIRWVRETPDGRLVMENRASALDPQMQGRGIGTRLFADEVRGLSQPGTDFERIIMSAERGPSLNGYYTWARLGVDGPIPDEVLANLPPEFAGATRVSDLMATPEGRAWWRANGDTFRGTFDLTPGSYSMRTLDDYLRSHGLEPISEEG